MLLPLIIIIIIISLAYYLSIVNYSPLLNNKVILVRLKTKVIFRLSSLTTPPSPLYIYIFVYPSYSPFKVSCPLYTKKLKSLLLISSYLTSLTNRTHPKSTHLTSSTTCGLNADLWLRLGVLLYSPVRNLILIKSLACVNMNRKRYSLARAKPVGKILLLLPISFLYPYKSVKFSYYSIFIDTF